MCRGVVVFHIEPDNDPATDSQGPGPSVNGVAFQLELMARKALTPVKFVRGELSVKGDDPSAGTYRAGWSKKRLRCDGFDIDPRAYLQPTICCRCRYRKRRGDGGAELNEICISYGFRTRGAR